MNSSLDSSAWGQGYVDSHRALPEAKLNVSFLSENLLYVYPTLGPSPPANVLVDSGASHSFIDLSFVASHSIPTRQISPIHLCLFNGTSNFVIEQAV
jgi:hypothetical protein